MNIKNINTEKYYRKAGSPVTICQNSVTVETCAVIYPLRYKNKMYLYGVNTEIGYNSEGYYFYIAPPDGDLSGFESGDYVACHGTRFKVDRAEKFYFGDRVLYCWAVLREINLTEDGE